jgi:hypothetical protein
MRRTRLGVGIEERNSLPRAAVREALLFDVSPPDNDDDTSLALRRLSMFSFAPMLLAATHAVVGTTLLIQGVGSSSWDAIFTAVLPLLLAMVLDAAAAVLLATHRKLGLAPHHVARLLIAYLGASGVLWMLFASGAQGFTGIDHASFLPLVLGAGVSMRSLTSVGSPPLAVTNALAGTIGAALFSGDDVVTATIAALSLLTVGYSVAITRNMLSGSRRRLQLDYLAKKALNFVAEFEASGRGWFWETNHAGTLSYVSQQLADDFKTTP